MIEAGPSVWVRACDTGVAEEMASTIANPDTPVTVISYP